MSNNLSTNNLMVDSIMNQLFAPYLSDSPLPSLPRQSLVSYLKGINQIIVHEPATIILYKDGREKTVVKCCKDDTYNQEVGIMQALIKGYLSYISCSYSVKELTKYINKKVVVSGEEKK